MSTLQTLYPNITRAFQLWRGGAGTSFESTALHGYLNGQLLNGNLRVVVLPEQIGTDARANNPLNIARVSYPILQLPDAERNYTVNLSVRVNRWAKPNSTPSPSSYRRIVRFELHKTSGGVSTGLLATGETQVGWVTEIGTSAVKVVNLSFVLNPGDADVFEKRNLELRIIGDSTGDGDNNYTLNTPGCLVYDARVTLTYYGDSSPPAPPGPGESDLSVGGAPQGHAPYDWRLPALRYRALANSNVMRRHPLMAASAGSIYAYQQGTGSNHRVRSYGDYLFVELPASGAPFMFYWGPTVTVAGATLDPAGSGAAWTVLPASEAEFAAARSSGTTGAWSGVETYREDRNLVAPSFRVLSDNADMSAYLQEFSSDGVTLVGPPSLAEFLGDVGLQVRVLAGQTPLLSGRLVRADLRPYANVRRLSLSLVPESRYFDIDLSDLDLTQEEGLPSSELAYITTVLRASGFRNQILQTQHARWRPISFWTQVPPAGPGFDTDEQREVYWNTSLGSTFGVVQGVANANMLEVFDLPNGDLLLDQIVPFADLTLQQLLTTSLPQMGGSPETALVRVYGQDAQGNYTPDPRLDIGGISLALDEGFAEIEVEAFSNTVSADVIETWAPFVQGLESPATETPYFDASLPAFTRDSSTVRGDNAWNDTPWKFRKAQDQVPKDTFVPRHWFEDKEMSLGSSAITATTRDTWGLGSRWVNSKGLLLAPLNQRLSEPELSQQAGFLGINPSDVVAYGFSASATGTWTAGATWRFTVKVPMLDSGSIKITPMLGKFTPEFGPRWLPNLEELVQAARTAKPRKARRVQNQLVAQIGAAGAVNVPAQVLNLSFEGRAYYDAFENAAANHLATWLTAKEALRSRQVELRFAGAHVWGPNSFVAIARRPEGGAGTPVQVVDVLLVLEPPLLSGRVNGEVWSSVRCGYVGAFDLVDGTATFDMPLSWGSVWDTRYRDRTYL
jgi:hypothetical protein